MSNNIKIILNNIFSHIENMPSEAIIPIKAGNNTNYARLTDVLYEEISYEIPGAEFAKISKPNWDGKIHIYKRGYKSATKGKFYTGVYAKVLKCVYKHLKVIPEIIDNRTKPEKTLDLKWDHDNFQMRNYQNDTVDECIDKGRGIIEVATGGGKTIIAAKIIHDLGVAPFNFYVLTKDLLYQSKKRLEQAMPGLEVGVIGDGVCDIKDINVVTIQTVTSIYGDDLKKDIKKYSNWDEDELELLKTEDLSHVETKKIDIQNLIHNVKGVYFDEVHHAAAKTCQKVLEKSENCFYLFGGSATPEREDNADLMIEGLFGQKRGRITASFLIKEDHLMRPDIYFLRLKSKRERVVSYDDSYKKHIIENNERNEYICRIAKELEKKGLQTLILVQRIAHGEELQSRIENSVFIHGKSTQKKRNESLRKFEDKEIKILIGSTIADEGLDLPILSAVILGGGGKSATRMKQRVGRVIRKSEEKKVALVFDFMDKGKYVNSHAKARYENLLTEEEFNIVEVFNLEKDCPWTSGIAISKGLF